MVLKMVGKPIKHGAKKRVGKLIKHASVYKLFKMAGKTHTHMEL